MLAARKVLALPCAERWLLIHALLMLPAVTLALKTIGLRRCHLATVAAHDRSDASFRWAVGLRQSLSIDFTFPVPLQFPDSHWVRFAT